MHASKEAESYGWEWVLESTPDYTEATLLLGDVIHNLRAAMDYAMWAITPPNIQESKPTRVAYPLHSSNAGYEGSKTERKDWYGPTVFEVLEMSQPFKAVGSGRLPPLHILQFLSNTDKHRLLNIVAHNQVDMGDVGVDPEPPGGVNSKVNDGLVDRGSVLARVEFKRPVEKSSVTLNPVFAYEQVFRYIDQDGAERWLQVGDAMNEIGPDVVEAVGHLLSAHAKDSGEEAGTS